MPVDLGLVLTKYLPILNMILVIFVVAMFIRLFSRDAHDHIYTTPWKLLFVAVLIFIVETILTVLRHAKLITFLHDGNYLFWNGVMEVMMITLFIYTLLLQKDHVKKSGFE